MRAPKPSTLNTQITTFRFLLLLFLHFLTILRSCSKQKSIGRSLLPMMIRRWVEEKCRRPPLLMIVICLCAEKKRPKRGDELLLLLLLPVVRQQQQQEGRCCRGGEEDMMAATKLQR